VHQKPENIKKEFALMTVRAVRSGGRRGFLTNQLETMAAGAAAWHRTWFKIVIGLAAFRAESAIA
jgi:hypothetical protein